VKAAPFHPETVFFLGAGASACLGYPLGSDLLPSLSREVDSSRLVNLQDAWKKWKQFTDSAKEALVKDDRLARLVLNPNPEIALSAIDLMDAALEWEDEEAEESGILKANQDFNAGLESIRAYYRGPGREVLSEARMARTSLLHSLNWYFSLKHGEIIALPRSSRDYLRGALAKEGLKSGDVVVTTNWDAVAELTLTEDGQWNPADGYGFSRRLVNALTGPNGRPRPRPPDVTRSSVVKVLKLHGSFGWYEYHEKLFLGYHDFLYHFPFQHGSETITLKDAATPELTGYETTILLYPSFLKRVRIPELYEVWNLAGEAVRVAKKVVVIGYSLPEADTAVRTLLLPLRFRALKGDVRVVVFDKSNETIGRWQEFLGGNAQTYQRTVCE